MPVVRNGHLRGRDRGGAQLRRPTGSLLRPALEAAIAVARAGELEQPPVPSPTKLLPYIEFSKYPPAALDVARRVLDEDDAFRGRVEASVDLDQIGEASRLFLSRPDGWDLRLADIEAAADDRAQSQVTQRQERRATKQLEITREALNEAKKHAYAEAAAAGQLREDLAAERSARQVLEDRLGELEATRQEALDQRGHAVRELKAVESRLAERTAELKRALSDLAGIEQALGDERGRADATDAVDAAPPPLRDLAPPPAERSLDRAALAEGSLSIEQQPDRAVLAEAIGAASAAAAQLASALERAASELHVDPVASVEPRSGTTPVRRARQRRRPTPLPGGVFDDSTEAARALVAEKEMLLLVDGYNVTLTRWPELPLRLQRERLVDGLSALHARTGVGVIVVFDGSEEGHDLPPASRMRGVQVRFTDPGVEADDVIIDWVGRIPDERPVTVVSSDNRVRAGATAGGANVLFSQQLTALLQ